MNYNNPTPKVAGNPCEHCGAKLVKSPKTGKIFCEKKCWLNKPQGSPSQEQQDDHIVVPETKPDWDKIREEKSANINHLNARTAAVQLVLEMIENGMTTESALNEIRRLTREIENI